MDSREPIFIFGELELEVWSLVTSYLDFRSLVPLIKACNKHLRHKLLVMGGIRSVTLHCGPDPFGSTNLWLPYRPSHMVRALFFPPIPTYKVKSFIPENFFHKLTKLNFAEEASQPIQSNFGLANLPRTLTHLEWWCPTRPAIWISNTGLTMKTHLPNLRTLALTCKPESPTFFASLPSSIESLSIAIVHNSSRNLFVEWLDDPLRTLPEATTSLFWTEQVVHRELLLPFNRLSSSKIASVTSLSLPYHDLVRSEDQKPIEKLPPTLRSLSFCNIDPFLSSSLPRTITEVSKDSASGWGSSEQWPETLKRVCYQILPSQVSPFSAPDSVTELTCITGVYDQVPNTWFTTVTAKNLVSLNLPCSILPEWILNKIPPFITRLRVKDILLNGSSLPSDLDSLHSIQQFGQSFSVSYRPYLLICTCQDPLLTISTSNLSLPVSLKTLALPLPKILSLATNSLTLPPGLTDLQHIVLSSRDIPKLPQTLTKLHFYQFDQLDLSEPMELKYIKDRCPNLTSLSSSNPPSSSHGTRRGSLVLDYQYYPHPPSTIRLDTSDGADPSRTEVTSSSTPPTNTLRLPDDAIQLFLAEQQASQPSLTIDSVDFHVPRLCWTVSSFVARKAVFIGTYSLQYTLVSNGFVDGLVKLDLGQAKLLPMNRLGLAAAGLPRLPPTLTHLIVGRSFARRLVWTEFYPINTANKPDYVPIKQLPAMDELPISVTRLGLILPRDPTAGPPTTNPNKKHFRLNMWQNFNRWNQILELDITMHGQQVSDQLLLYIEQGYKNVQRTIKKGLPSLKAKLPRATRDGSSSDVNRCSVM